EVGAQRTILEAREHFAQAADLFAAGKLGDEAGRHAFQRRPGGDHLDHLGLGLAHHIDAAPRHRPHKAFALELRHRLPHRRAADAEVLRELAFVETDILPAAIHVHRHDDVFQRHVRLVLETERGVDRLDRQARRSLRKIGPAGRAADGWVVGHHWYTIFQKHYFAQWQWL